MPGISVRRVNVSYQLLGVVEHNAKRSLLSALRRDRTPTRRVKALQDVSLEIGEGARVALVGANGSGKSTLLAVLAGVLPPTTGSVVVEGRVLALLGGAAQGLDQEATGAENVVSLGVQLGERPAVMRERVGDVTEFSGLGDRMRDPVYSYSTGMQARLRFSILTSLRPDVLLVDEGLATADAEFTARAQVRLRDFMSSAGVVVLASHGHALLLEHCTTGIWVDRGAVRARGSVGLVLDDYYASHGGVASWADPPR